MSTIMAPKLSLVSSTISLLVIILFVPPTIAGFVDPIFTSPENLCPTTPYSSFCRSSLPRDKPYTMHDYTRISIKKSLGIARDFLSLVEYYLDLPSTLSISTIYALEDCYHLANLNVDFLLQSLDPVNSKDNLDSSLAEELHALLSAILTNQQTCLEGLEAIESSASSIKNGLMSLLSNGTMSYSVSLALFKHGWVRRVIKGRLLGERKSDWGRKLLSETFMDDVAPSNVVVVNPDGSGNFTTINAAVAAAPNNTANSSQYFVIRVVAGVYEEYVSIPSNKKYLMMIGDGINRTIITGNRSVGDGWTTFNSATFAVSAKGFVAVNITFRNTAGAIKYQAVALRSGADLSAFYSCSFEGYQDTLYTHSLRQFYRDCDIYGTVDFIFGNAAVVLQNCNIYPRLPLQGQFNAITAQGRSDPNQNTGTSIHNCSIKAADELAYNVNWTTKTYLGRPWKEYSRTVYMQSFMDGLIDPAGWREWSGDFALSTLYYAEYDNSGLGSNTTNRVTWPGYHVINATDAVNFTVSNFILGEFWLPATEVPFTGGLL